MVMRKGSLLAVLFISVLLVSMLVGVRFVKIGYANPVGWNPPGPTIQFVSPVSDGIYSTNNVPITFYVNTSNFTYTYNGFPFAYLKETFGTCFVDGHKLVSFVGPNSSCDLVSVNLCGLWNGLHKVEVKGESDWGNSGAYAMGIGYCNEVLFFNVNSTWGLSQPTVPPTSEEPVPSSTPAITPIPTPPKGTFPYGSFWITSPSNQTYNSNSALNLEVKGEVTIKSNSQLFLNYSLDNQANHALPITLTAQPGSVFSGSFDTTVSLPLLSVGSHNIVIFGDFEVWNTTVESGSHLAQTAIFFTVNSSFPQSSISPITEPTSTPKQPSGFLGTNLPTEYGYALVAVLVMVAVAGLSLVYFKKLRK
jgi:hypothetical protein